jgi:hypothetical protein
MEYTSKEVYEWISQQANDPIIKWKTCAVSGAKFPIYQSDLEFYDKISPTFNGVKYQIPTPTLCPEERQRRRLMFRNERKLYKRKCDATGKQIISIYSPDKPYKVYDQKIWRSDSRDPMDYGRDFDFSKPFFQQFSELLHEVPLFSLSVVNSEDCDYTNATDGCKSCYMSFNIMQSQNLYYSLGSYATNNSCDVSYSPEK